MKSKSYLLTLLFIAVVFSALAQNPNTVYPNQKLKRISREFIFSETVTNDPTPAYNMFQKSGNSDLTIIPIGSAANAYGYGYAGGQRTIIWVDPVLDIFVNLHRETHSTYSGNLAIDITYDRGNTFQNNIRVYESTMAGGQYNLDAARYPQGGIYNPPGNTNPANAYFAFFAPTLDQSNNNWGGYCFGSANLENPGNWSKQLRTSGDGVYQYIPNGFTITADGVAWAVDLNQRWYNYESVDYRGKIILNRGLWSNASNDYQYDELLIEFPTRYNDLPPDIKIAFAPDGKTGYIVALADDSSVPFSQGAFYPVIFKTTDYGDTWDYYGGIQIGGQNGIESIVYEWLSDQQIYDFFYDPIPYRDEILYTTAFDFDLVVDAKGNPHIAVVVGICDGDYAIYIPEDYMAVFDIFSFDGGDTWNAYHLDNIKTLRGYFGDEVTEDNRVNASITPDGSNLFISWLDTRNFGSEDNNYPDIYCIGIDAMKQKLTQVVNVTSGTDAWAQAYFAVAPHYVFVDGSSYNIPFTYEQMNPNDPEQQVTFMYIKDFKFNSWDFNETGVNNLVIPKASFEIKSIYPIPAHDYLNLEIQLMERSDIQIEVFDVTGQKVLERLLNNYQAGTNRISLNIGMLKAGMYTLQLKTNYTVQSNKFMIL